MATDLIIRQLPQLYPKERFYCGGIFAFFKEEDNNSETFFHIIMDRSGRTGTINQKFPGGQVTEADYDDDIWYRNMRDKHLPNALFSKGEIEIIIKLIKEKVRPDFFGRTLIREMVSETGYVPTEYLFLIGKKQRENNSQDVHRPFYQLFFAISRLIEPRSFKQPSSIIQSNGLSQIKEVLPNEKFIPSDEAVTNPRLTVKESQIFLPDKLVPSHFYAAREFVDKNFANEIN